MGKSYRFGDITKSIFGQTAKVFTGKEHYEFGDLSRALDEKAKQRVAEFTRKHDYEVGDISKEILRRLSHGEYKVEDIMFLCKVLLTLGAELSPIANALPAKL